MQRVFVLDKKEMPLMPCLSVRARELLKCGKAKVYRAKPFTIILTQREGGNTQPVECKIDPGSKKTGMVLVGKFKQNRKVIFAINMGHRANAIREAILKRRANRRSRRNRKTRYRPPRFNNRTKKAGWLPPSLNSRVQNIFNWTAKLIKLTPVSSLVIETMRFDTQKIQNPEIAGIEYQKGELLGTEIREYLLEKFKRTCVYCGAKNIPLEIDHIVSKSQGGSNCVNNLTLACKECNIKKANKPIEQFIKNKEKLNVILSYTKKPLANAAAMNASRYAIGEALKSFGLPITFFSGGQTKYNRLNLRYKKDHWIDAACIGITGSNVYIPSSIVHMEVIAIGRGTRQMCRVDSNGFPRTVSKSQKSVQGFQTGDIVKAIVTKGKKTGTYIGRVAVRKTGNFNIKIGKKTLQGIDVKYCKILQKTDGYLYI